MLPCTDGLLNCYPQFSLSQTCFCPCYFTHLQGFLILSVVSFVAMNKNLRSPKCLSSQRHFISLCLFPTLLPSVEGCETFPCFLSRLHIPDTVWWRQSIRHNEQQPAWLFFCSPNQRFTWIRISTPNAFSWWLNCVPVIRIVLVIVCRIWEASFVVCEPLLIFAGTKLRLAKIFDCSIQQIMVKFLNFW
jgi:hypothetical protein